MGGTVSAAPGDAGNEVQIHTPAVDRLAEVSRKLRKDVAYIRQHPFESDYKEATSFFGNLRALKGMISILAEQPGYRPADTEGVAVRSRMVPLAEKMEEISKAIEASVNLMNPLAATAPQRIEDRADETGRLAGILLDPTNAADIKEVRDDKAIPETWKAMFFYQLGWSIHAAMEEILKTKHEEKMFDAVNKALDTHSEATMVGGCLWASQAAASAGGSLPGPNSYYVGMIRIKAISGLRELTNRTPHAVLGDLLPHWFEALKFSDVERASFENNLKEFNEAHGQGVSHPDATARKVGQGKARQVYEDKLLPSVKSGGNPQAGWKLSGSMTVLNLLCLYLVWPKTPDPWSHRNWADVANAGANFGGGICATFVRMKGGVGLMKSIVDSPWVGGAIGLFGAAVAIIEGIDTAIDAWPKKDYWLVGSGVLQLSSGVCMLIGIAMASPGWQLAGLIIGAAASVVAVLDDLAQDKMVQFLTELIQRIKAAKSTWDGTDLTLRVGIRGLIEDIEKLVVSCQVTELSYDRDWTGAGGLCLSHDIVHDKLNAFGITDGLHRERLCRKVWTK